MMNIISEKLSEYIDRNSTGESKPLSELNRQTHLKALMPQMLSGKVQGKFLEFISYMIQPKYILEVGTYTGYSAICLAKGLQKKGKLITIDINDELTAMVKQYAELENVIDQLDIKIGNAIDIIPTLTETFDLVFIDADKINYCNYFDLVIDKVKTGGFILADNVLWSSKVIEDRQDKDTMSIDAYNKKITNDGRVENVIISIRDGISIARKIG